MSEWKPIICIDFDGVIHSYTSGWKGEAVILDDPVPGAFDALKEYLKHFKVCIYSSRSKKAVGIMAMKEWFLKHGFEYIDQLEFPDQKPPAFITIDDRCLTFTGIFPAVSQIKSFKPWNIDTKKPTINLP